MTYAAIDAYRMRRRGEAFGMEPYMLAGIVLFGAAGVGDMIWPQIFGIETGLEALVSPSHLLLMIGGLLLATFGLRAAWTDTDDASRTATFVGFLPTAISVTQGAALIGFFTMYASAFTLAALTGGSGTGFEGVAMHALGAILFTNALFVAAMLTILCRWTPPAGTFTLLFGVVAVAMTALDGFDRIQLAVAALGAGITADLLARRLPGAARPRAIRAIATAVPVVLWVSYFAIYAVTGRFEWSVEMWTGATVLCALEGFGLSLLVVPPPVPTPETSATGVPVRTTR